MLYVPGLGGHRKDDLHVSKVSKCEVSKEVSSDPPDLRAYDVFYSGLQTDQLNVLQPYYMETCGWTSTQISNPVTYAGLLVIVVTFFVGTLFMKFGVPKVMGTAVIVSGLCTIALGYVGDNYTLFFILLFLVRTLTVFMQMGGFQVCTNWFMQLRGRALGLVTVGAPLETMVWNPMFTLGLAAIGFSTSHLITGIAVVALGAAALFCIKNAPEDYGLYPDGADEPPQVRDEQGTISVRKIFSNPGSWLLIVSFGILQAIIVAVMAFFVTRMTLCGVAPSSFLPALSIGSLLAMPVSYLLGMADDHFGTVKATLILCLGYVAVLVGMLAISYQPGNLFVLMLATVGVAGICGGTPNLHPSITAYVFGRKNYQAANRWIMAIQAIFMALAPLFMSSILDKRIAVVGEAHCLDLAYIIMLGLVVVAAVCLVIIGRKPDFDRQ